MRILLCNKFYYRRGGDCIYTMDLEQMLRAHGHEVAIFSQQYPLNEPSEWSRYWPREFKMKPSLSMFDSLMRPFGLGEVKHRFEALLNDFKPEVVHLNNIHTQLSPVIAELAHRRGIRVVWTIHDSKPVCPCYTCQRDGKWCEECFTDKRAVLDHRCMTGGLLGSYIGYQEALKWTPERVMASVDTMICPSQFMANTLIKGGYRAEKLKVMSNFIDVRKVMGETDGQRPFAHQKQSDLSSSTIGASPLSNHSDGEDYFIYVGRVNAVKGLPTLCKVAATLPYRLIIVGSGELEEPLRRQYAQAKHIEWRGQMEWNDFRPLLERARFMVLPAEWSENNPLSVIESLCLGTPVLGARIGGIPELIDDENGMTFESGNATALASAIESMWNRPFDYQTIARKAIDKYQAETYYNNLLNNIYEAQY